MRHHHGPDCGCPKRIVHPTKHNCVENCTESVVEHIHPSHTTVMNHHLVRNRHVYPHSTSVQNTCNSVDEFGGAFNTPPQVSPAYGPGSQVAGAMSPGMNNGNQVAGMMDYGHAGKGCCGNNYKEMHNWKKPNKWC
ncbi:spore coat protein [Virgibacillus dakarensis]|uniref:Spore coat protein D n=1 Tax=Lentibacillus populi TaxID=1827502 RepID=A0A9W5TYI7_9BACI|nr:MULTISPECIES: spore coat protein [Bacillaceae]MBT2216411.1 spore coat protein [Virgibacillus dakarensis]MTW86602.1 spore coat protein [Virgibacillus dakarensis]GGB47293.1 spore coat protein D [Lentibacillus populi]